MRKCANVWMEYSNALECWGSTLVVDQHSRDPERDHRWHRREDKIPSAPDTVQPLDSSMSWERVKRRLINAELTSLVEGSMSFLRIFQRRRSTALKASKLWTSDFEVFFVELLRGDSSWRFSVELPRWSHRRTVEQTDLSIKERPSKEFAPVS